MKVHRFKELSTISEKKEHKEKIKVGDVISIKDFNEVAKITSRDDKMTKFKMLSPDGILGGTIHGYITNHFDFLIDKGRITILSDDDKKQEKKK